MRIREARLVEPRRIELVDRDLEPRPGQALLRIVACGYCMTDAHKYEGHDPDVVLPFVLEHEASAVVVETNPPDAEFKQGDRVTGAFEFAFATHAVASFGSLVRVPDDLPMEHALGEPLACVTNISRAASPELGDHVVLIGCGAMGLMLLTCLARSPAAPVVAVDVLPERLSLARELGATHAFNPRECDAAAAIMEVTEGRGADVIVEFTGRPASNWPPASCAMAGPRCSCPAATSSRPNTTCGRSCSRARIWPSSTRPTHGTSWKTCAAA